MSEAAAAEPTMEEILASIRRIISEDEAPAAEAAPEPEAHHEEPAPVVEAKAPEPEPAPPPPPAAKEEVLELTQRVEPAPPSAPAAPAPPMGDLDFSDADVPAAAAPTPPAPRKVESLVSDHAATAAASHFGALSQSLLMPSTGRTLEDVVKELMKPMLKQWLDENLPGITEAAVRSEVERISRRGG